VLLCTPLTKTALTDMALRRCHRLCNVIGIAKYRARFEQTSCVYLGEEMKRIIDCESKCAKDRSSYPCYMVRVNISGVPEQGVLFENFLTYLEQDKLGALPTRGGRKRGNDPALHYKPCETLRRRRNFTCYFRGPDSRQKNSVLLTKIYTKEQAKHCAIWPAFAVSIGAIVLIELYLRGCTRRGPQDKTVIA
uniref:WSC domain-containing protein n=1 Tax=Macrostomum lignano TaxID=282301 RepID=A0A1I8FNJ7_9PLAT